MESPPSDPFDLFAGWFAEAEAGEPNDPNAMTLATVDATGRPSARIVLLKGWDRDGFVFYTNTLSRKGSEIAGNPAVALLFHWKSLRRQARIEGRAAPVSDAEADAYFLTRPRQSRVGAWASEQSRPLADRATLEARVAKFDQTYPDVVPRPPHWSGYRVTPERFEFWRDMPFRLHDRFLYGREGDGWTLGRLYP